MRGKNNRFFFKVCLNVKNPLSFAVLENVNVMLMEFDA